jgi:hypothetical protein
MAIPLAVRLFKVWRARRHIGTRHQPGYGHGGYYFVFHGFLLYWFSSHPAKPGS